MSKINQSAELSVDINRLVAVHCLPFHFKYSTIYILI